MAMFQARKLSAGQIEAAVTELKNWRIEDNQLRATLKFNDFNEAFGFLSRIALIAEKADHHPDFFCSYNKVELRLFTHSEKSITAKDLEMAKRINEIVGGGAASGGGGQ